MLCPAKIHRDLICIFSGSPKVEGGSKFVVKKARVYAGCGIELHAATLGLGPGLMQPQLLV
jgi:hypothetical protein